MKSFFISFCLFISVLSHAYASETSPVKNTEIQKSDTTVQKDDLGYVLGAGDSIQISVFKEPDMTLRLKIPLPW